ncbi:Sugar kinase of the NBD/HSP70 family, may contain an N-terminal HTH domain [Leifsonia sp. 98AMF]|uniref:ROK family transcriptional regulator n=1 Tax=Microbacteriaceae TaxID=85023 RepID=UPI000382B1BA|nr:MULTISPECIES: ROK family transcriptional regulator [Microbacteriaceae]SDG99935.1 Sugar kinase of the NBD/HSP70 family, may contain an N-terminal HTH domain [Leifsonia sp. 197AMF]SDJ41468.1 Sugar kinase of the NBD/HSP70 family, may contain an N-terminal HTH domain [Leifsonia sp. 466MF]SDK35653.1 Sugar kinase of the NBD/HSP70 family, may contain an N-terminal HTH domain [Leifsonia sp. 157MF]SDN61866.1 Sugar kinase of the NBD/HSP70 family, may contain an N-terminal HTH domain [Leifsonia sp. 509
MTATQGLIPRGARNPGSQGALRHLNQERLVEFLLANGPSTQAELARGTGLSTATVSNIVRDMAAKGVVTTSPVTSSGRRALLVQLTDTGDIAVGVDFGRRHVRIVLTTLGYDVIAEEQVALEPGYDVLGAVREAARLLDRMLAEGGHDRESVLAVGVGIPGPIDRRTGTVLQGAILPEWVGITRRELEDVFGFPVVVDNDANLGALAEVTWGANRGERNLIFVKIGTGIGAGLILNGQPYYGFLGITGELGHTPVAEHGVICRCGNRGCLETIASTSVMLESLGRGDGARTASDILRRGLAKDPAVLRVVSDAGTAIGQAIGNIANVINPELVLIGGPLVGLGDALLDPIRHGIRQNAIPIIAGTTTVRISSLGDRAESLGAAAIVIKGALAGQEG